MTGPVAVGFDGSSASATAAWWAAHEAVDRHLSRLQRMEAELLHPYDEGDEADEQGRPAGAVAPWRDKSPETEVVYHVVLRPAAVVPHD